MMISRSLIFTFFTVIFTLSTASANTRLDGVIAIVDEDVILESELERKMQTVRQQLESKGTRLPSSDVLEKQVLERLVLDSIQLQMANRAGVRISDAQVNQVISRMAAENSLSLSGFRAQLQRSGLNFNFFREDLRQEMMISRLRQAQVARRVFVSEQEVTSLVELIDEQGASQLQYHLGHIMVAVPETARNEDIQAARDKVERIIKQLRGGSDFAQTAIAESDGQDSLQGGDFGWKTINQMPTLFVGAIKQLKLGSISEPIRSSSGFHILKLYDTRGEKRHIVSQTNSRHILIKPSAIISDSKAKELLNNFRTQVLKGSDFNKLAKEHSDDLGTANQGGELGWNNSDIFAPAFAQKLSELKKGEISRPFKTEFGWHIVQLLDRRNDDQTLEMKQQRAMQILRSRKFDEEVETWMREIRERAYVKILGEDKA